MGFGQPDTELDRRHREQVTALALKQRIDENAKILGLHVTYTERDVVFTGRMR